MLINIEITNNERDIIIAALSDFKASLYNTHKDDLDTRVTLENKIKVLRNKL